MDTVTKQEMVHVTVNNQIVEVPKGTSVREAARSAGFYLPALCNVGNNSTKPGQCGLCVAEVQRGKRSEVVPTCKTAVDEGMVVHTFTPAVLAARELAGTLRRDEHFAAQNCGTCPEHGGCKFLRLMTACSTGRDQETEDTLPWIIVDTDRCTSCGQCEEACKAQDVGAIQLQYRGKEKPTPTIDPDTCRLCGQCIKHCPTGTLRERSYVQRVLDWLNDPEMYCVVQYAPAIAPTLDVTHGQIAGGLRRLGFKAVFPTGIWADIITLEETHEALSRLDSGENLPIVTSCCPGHVRDARKYLKSKGWERHYKHISTCLSPQEAGGNHIRQVWTHMHDIDPAKLRIISIMPCTAKAWEAQEHGSVDAVLTTRQFTELLAITNLRLALLPDEEVRNPFAEHSGGAEIFARTGGVTEAVLRHVHFKLTCTHLLPDTIKRTVLKERMHELEVKIGELTITALVVQGLDRAHEVWDLIEAGQAPWLLVEIMACPEGCINGGGQLKSTTAEVMRCKMRLRHRDVNAANHSADGIGWLEEHYRQDLGGGPGSLIAHTLFHEHDH